MASGHTWAQQPCHDTIVWVYDTICEGQTYDFNGRQLTHAGLYYDTLPRYGSSCDSLIRLRLALLENLDLSIYPTKYCKSPLGYSLQCSDYHPTYLLWSALPDDTSLHSQQNQLGIFVNPSKPTTYTLYADYRESPPQCPATASITINPIQPVVAGLRTYPDILDYDHLILRAEDYSVGNRTAEYGGWAGRNWYINGELQPHRDSLALFQISPYAPDTINLFMEAYSPTCLDTLSRRIPFRRVALYFPNTFTPQAESNNRFAPRLRGVSQYEIWIYDRRGALIFHDNQPLPGWDGTAYGRPCPQGTYAYHCRYRDIAIPNGWQHLQGTITLIR